MDITFDVKELYDMEKKNGRQFDYVRLTSSDLNGVLRTNVVPRRYLERNLKGYNGFRGICRKLEVFVII